MGLKILNRLRKEIINLDNNIYEDLEEDEFIYEKEESPSSLLNFYIRGQFLRDEDSNEIIKVFKLAYDEDKLKAIKILFYIRDKYEGLGERYVFQTIINYLGKMNDAYLKENLDLIPIYGRWDDLYSLFNTELERDAINLIKATLKEDLNSEIPSNLCKWLKSENTSSEKSKVLGKKTRALLKLSSKEYRKLLSSLRKKLDIIERTISSGNWSDIQYGNLSLNNLRRYNRTFMRHDNKRYTEFLRLNHINRKENFEKSFGIKPEKVFPYNIVGEVINENSVYSKSEIKEIWSGLPNFIGEEVGDTITCLGLKGHKLKEVSNSPAFLGGVGTALYLLEKNKGRYKDYIVTMSPKPNFMKIAAKDIDKKIEEIARASLTEEVNVEATLDLILFAAIKYDMKSESIPKRVFFITDGKCKISLLSKKRDRQSPYFINAEEYENIKGKWNLAGLFMPSLTFWIIDEAKDTSNIIIDSNSFIFAFGYSNDVFESILRDEYISPNDLMNDTFNSKRYLNIKKPRNN